MSWLFKDPVVIMKEIMSWLFKDSINSGLFNLTMPTGDNIETKMEVGIQFSAPNLGLSPKYD